MISLFGFGSSGRALKIATHTFGDDQVYAVTSDFNHRTKAYYKSESHTSIPIERLHVSPYNKNLSIKRIISHLSFARKLNNYLRQIKDMPDLVYCSMPSSSAAFVAGKFCKKYKIPFIIDVIDLWPDSLIPIMPHRKYVKALLSPWQMITHSAYKMANYISGESKKYAEEAHNINKVAPYSHTYLGVNQKKINSFISESDILLEKPEDEFWIGYGGSLGQSYDFEVILEGLRYLKQKNVKYKMWFIGDGEKAPYIHKIADQNDLNITITGRLDYKDFLKYLSYCDIAINTFKEGTLVVHSYKFNDYVATGCYILNNLLGETAEMVDRYKIGKNFNRSNFNILLYKSVQQWNDIKPIIQHNLQKLISEELDEASIYKRLKNDIHKAFF